MACPRVYRHDVRRPECGSNRMPKDGASKGRRSITAANAAAPIPDAADQERALTMYQEGSSLSAIARIFGVSVQAVSQWVKGGRAARSRMRRRGEKRTAGVVSSPSAVVIAFDEIGLTGRRGGGASGRMCGSARRW